MNENKNFGILKNISFLKKEGELYKFELTFYTENNDGELFKGDEAFGTFYADSKSPKLNLNQKYELTFDGYDILITGYLSKSKLLEKIENETPIEKKVITELRKQTYFLNKVSYRVGWFYYLSIISLVISIITWLYIFINWN